MSGLVWPYKASTAFPQPRGLRHQHGAQFVLHSYGIGGLASGSGVAAWPDYGRWGNTFTQGTAGNRPLYAIDSALGNQPTITNASGKWMEVTDNTSLDYRGGFTVFAVVKPTALGATTTVISKQDYNAGVNKREWWLGKLNTNYWAFALSTDGTANTTITGTSTISNNTWAVVGGTWDGSTGYVWVNGVAENSAAVAALNQSDIKCTLGCNLNAGTASANWVGSILYAAAWPVCLPNATVQELCEDLGRMAGVSIK